MTVTEITKEWQDQANEITADVLSHAIVACAMELGVSHLSAAAALAQGMMQIVLTMGGKPGVDYLQSALKVVTSEQAGERDLAKVHAQRMHSAFKKMAEVHDAKREALSAGGIQ